MKYISIGYSIILPFLGCLYLHAEEEKKPQGFSGITELGIVVTSGNSSNTTTTGRIDLNYDLRRWLHHLKVNVINTQTDGIRTAERYNLNTKSNYKLQNEQFLFLSFTHDIDNFSGFQYQSAVAMGYGRNIISNDTMKWSVDVGPGYRISEFKSGGNNKEAIVHVGSNAKYSINKLSSLKAELNVDHGKSQTISILDLGYINQLSKSLAIKVGYNIKKSSNVPIGSKATDTITSISLLYSF